MIKKIYQTGILKSQNLLNLDVKYFLKASTYSSIQQVIGVISGLIISYFFGHFASVELYGNYNYVITVVGFLTILALPGLNNYLIRSIGQKFDTSYLRGVKYKLIFSLIGIPIFIVIAVYNFINGQPSLGTAFILAGLFFPLLGPLQLFNEFFVAKKKFKEITFYSSLSSVLSIILLCFSIYFSGSLLVILLAYFLAIFIPTLLGFTGSTKYIDKTRKKDKDLLHMGLFVTGLSILPWTTSYLGLIIITILLGPELLAIFVVAHKLPLYIQKNLFVFHKPLTAKLASQTNKQHIKTIKKHSLKLILWGIGLAIPLYVLSPLIINFIFTQKYDTAIPLAQLLSLSVIPLPLTWLTEDILVFQKIKKPQLYAKFSINFIRIVLYFILIPIYKLYGLVVIYIFDRYITLAINLFIIRNHNKSLLLTRQIKK